MRADKTALVGDFNSSLGDTPFLIVDEGLVMPDGQLPKGRRLGGPGVALEDLPEGGFGWHLIRSLCADLTYSRVDRQNRLAFILPKGGLHW